MESSGEYLPDQWLVELGRMTQSWAAFEQFFNLMLQKVAGIDAILDKTFTILIAHATMPQRLDMFASLCHDRLPNHPGLKGYKEVLAQIREAQSIRNKFTHNIIGVDADDVTMGKISTISARGQLKMALQEVSLDELKSASVKLREAVYALYKLVLGVDPDILGRNIT
jgi:hypothetical protein